MLPWRRGDVIAGLRGDTIWRQLWRGELTLRMALDGERAAWVFDLLKTKVREITLYTVREWLSENCYNLDKPQCVEQLVQNINFLRAKGQLRVDPGIRVYNCFMSCIVIDQS